MVLVLKCLFSKFKKYFLFFSPSLCQRPLHLIMAPRVCRWTTFSNCNFFFSNSLYIVVLLVSYKSFSSSFLCRDVMTDFRFVSVNFILPLLCFAYCIDFERICIFIVSQRSATSTSVLFWYSFATSVIVVFIKLIYSLSDRKDVSPEARAPGIGIVCKVERCQRMVCFVPW